jgi:hypothetical protein
MNQAFRFWVLHKAGKKNLECGNSVAAQSHVRRIRCRDRLAGVENSCLLEN